MLAHFSKMTVRYKRGRVEHPSRQMVSPLRVGDVIRDGIARERYKPEHQPTAPTAYKRTAARLSSPDNPMTRCRVGGASNDR